MDPKKTRELQSDGWVLVERMLDMNTVCSQKKREEKKRWELSYPLPLNTDI